MKRIAATLLLVALITPTSAMADPTTPSNSDSPGRITGIGGVFIKSKDPKALVAWYRDVLGLRVEAWGGALLRYDAPKHPPVAVWSAFPESSEYFAPSRQPFMINYAVDDLDALLKKLDAKGIKPIKRDDQDANGKFAWILDPDGNKVELWQPTAATEASK